MAVGSRNTVFCDVCRNFIQTDDKEGVDRVVAILDELAGELAVERTLREEMGTENPSIWPALDNLWDAVQCVSYDDQNGLQELVMSAARFTRNLVAAVPENQQRAYHNEPIIRQLLHQFSSWSAMQKENTFPIARMLVQTLSNIVTSNEMLKAHLWEAYMSLPEEQLVLIRLLGSSNARTLRSVLILIFNCLIGGRERAMLLTTTPAGGRLCKCLLDRMASLFDDQESTDSGEAFDFCYHVFTFVFEMGFAPALYRSLSIADEIIAPHQTTLLKLLDAYLQTPQSASIYHQLCPLLSDCFFLFSDHARQAIGTTMSAASSMDFAQSNTAGLMSPQSVDLMLPQVCEAIVLITQCIITILLSAEAVTSGEQSQPALANVFMNARSSSANGLVETLVDLLRQLDSFLPRINFGRPAAPVPPGTFAARGADPTGFSYLKRDLVRLLGILSYNNKEIQDRVRQCNGITVIMNLCVIDERNPYLREHAIFTLRNVLAGNVENQAVVDSIKPSASWDDEGVLRELPGAVRK